MGVYSRRPSEGRGRRFGIPLISAGLLLIAGGPAGAAESAFTPLTAPEASASPLAPGGAAGEKSRGISREELEIGAAGAAGIGVLLALLAGHHGGGTASTTATATATTTSP